MLRTQVRANEKVQQRETKWQDEPRSGVCKNEFTNMGWWPIASIYAALISSIDAPYLFLGPLMPPLKVQLSSRCG